MIVSCTHCGVKFNLPDEKMKPGGVKIRCTKCKNIFAVPGTEESIPSEDLTAQEDSFQEDMGDDLAEFDTGEEDLELDTGDAADFDLGDDIDIDVGVDENEESKGIEFETGGEEGGGEVEFGAEESAEFDIGETVVSSGEDKTDTEENLGDLDLSLDDSSDASGEDIGSDLGGDFDLPSFDEGVAGDSTFGNEAEIEGGGGGFDMGDSLDMGMDVEPLGEIGAPLGEIEEPQQFARTPKKAKAKRRSPLLVALFIVFLMTAAAYFGYKTFFNSEEFDISTMSSLFKGKEDPMEGLMVVEDKINYFYVINNEAGKVLVIEGVVLNDSNLAKGHIKVAMKLYDKNGNELKKRNAFCGNILSVEELESLSKGEIDKILSNETGLNFDNAHIKSKTTVPFMVVIFGIPENTDNFKIEIEDAKNVG
jgi:predicted Zn finger-like uncharacterized protein